MTHISEILAEIMRDYRKRVEAEIERNGGFTGPVRDEQRQASAQLEWLDNRDDQEPLL